MALLTLTIGCFFIIASFPLLLYIFVLSQKPLLMIISLISAIFFLCSLLITSLIMFPIPLMTKPNYAYPLIAVIASVTLQETSRFAFIFVYRKVENGKEKQLYF